MKKRFWIVLVGLLAISLSLVSNVNAQNSETTLTGRIENGTQGADLAEKLPVILHVFREGLLTESFETESDSDGNFSFSPTELINGDQLVVVGSYQNISYSSSAIIYQTNQEIPEFTIVVYETTEDSSHIVVSQMTVMLNSSEGELRVGEYYLLSNFGDRTWVGTFDEDLSVKTTSHITLATDVESLWFSGGDLGDRFYSTDDGIVDTAPVLPGVPSAEIFFSYALPYDGEVGFSKQLNLPVEGVEFLVAEESGLTVEGEGINWQETIDTDTDTTASYGALGFDSGQALDFIVRDQKGGLSLLGWQIGIGVLSIVIAGLGIYWLLRKDRKVVLPLSADPVLKELAALEDQYAAGELQKKQYTKKRRALVDKIRKLVE